MKGDFSVEQFLRLYPGIDRSIIEEHARSLSPRYFEVFGYEEIRSHLAGLAKLSPENPAKLVYETGEDSLVTCTVLAYDYQFEFSLLAGILSTSGMNVLAGDVFTYGEPDSPGGIRIVGRGGRGTAGRAFIIDRFKGTVSSRFSGAQWERKLASRIREILLLLEDGSQASVKKAKETVNAWVAEEIGKNETTLKGAVIPLSIDIDSSGASHTTIRIVSEDSPFFLYSVSAALAQKGIRILRVRIETEAGRIRDEFDIVDAAGRKITDQAVLSRIRVSVLLTKQFTYFLGESPDPYSALVRFESLTDRVTEASGGRLIESISSLSTMKELAKLLGASDFLWEDFIRFNYEQLLPMLSEKHTDESFALPAEAIARALASEIDGAEGTEEKIRKLNAFKDNQIFLADLQHILMENFDFRRLSQRLVSLAEAVVSASFAIHYDSLVKRYGAPRTVAGQPARYAIFGLGKFGGMDLGYASDIEILFVYSDRGETDGEERIQNSEFFETLVRDATLAIEARREGIFRIDMRLRPFGKSSQLAVSLDQLCRYFAKEGGAHALERIAMVRLRKVAGDTAFGEQVERIRDELVYDPRNLSLDELARVRNVQLEEKSVRTALNAKYSRGALVDLEYAVQILQIKYAHVSPDLKTPIMSEALDALSGANVLEPEESRQLMEAYGFFRKLINGLRMLRGSAFDLSIPAPESDEFAHLSRRMGYESSGDLASYRKLYMEFETRSATIRVFLDRHLGKDSIIGEAVSGITDVILFREIPEEKAKAILAAAGFCLPARAFVNIRRMADRPGATELYARLSVLAFDIIKRMPDMDMALNNWERFIDVLGSPVEHYESLLAQPTELEILMRIFSGSQFLSDTLILHPGFLGSVISPDTINLLKSKAEYVAELEGLLADTTAFDQWLDCLRLYRKREILRIGTKDICLGAPIREVMAEISSLAEAIIGTALRRCVEERAAGADRRFCILAFGKLGGEELNYSSDIDILGIFDDRNGNAADEETCRSLMERIVACLASHTAEGYAYRVDLRLRPFGKVSSISTSFTRTVEYYTRQADLREVQALLKLRPVAGDVGLGGEFIREVRSALSVRRDRAEITTAIDQALKRMSAKALSSAGPHGINVKTGQGGIRSIEFTVQGLQMIHAHETLNIIEGNTLDALGVLESAGIIEGLHARALEGHYVFLRRLEHLLQIFEDQQIHALPSDKGELSALVRRIEGNDTTNEEFLERLKERLDDVERIMGIYLKA